MTWTPCAVRMPPLGVTPVLVTAEYRHPQAITAPRAFVTIAVWHAEPTAHRIWRRTPCWRYRDSEARFAVTHWQPLPAPAQ